ncbi:hypothetical protein [Sorangium sp. So ce1024]|uniref:hypothetical protein n=1 Tax=Sorangium sp. So ce1024 TaxID=3133327 RepID=UPI003F0B7C8E
MVIAVAALAAAYNLGKISVESDEHPQARQDAASQSDLDLRSTLSVTWKRLASCETTLQRRDRHAQKREGRLHVNEDERTPKRTPSPVPEPSEQCGIEPQVSELQMLAMDCRLFSGMFGAYKAILGSRTIDCESVLSIRDMARSQYLTCFSVIGFFESELSPGVASDRRGIDAMESAYMFKSYYGDVDIDELVKNPACVARMQAP